MWRNRHFRVKMVKDEEPKTERLVRWAWTPTDYMDIVATVGRSAASCVAVYVAADTVRRVVVYAVSAKV